MTNGEWAVHFDTTLGLGHVEYLDNRVNVDLTQADYDAHYAWLETTHQQVLDYDAEQQAIADSADSDDSSATV
ncbi:hypothetical protein [Vibrio viridaestus]|nr:hypothetical protein [Vibrio viridaestus]